MTSRPAVATAKGKTDGVPPQKRSASGAYSKRSASRSNGRACENQPTSIGNTGGTASNEYALIDPDFKFPSLLRYNIAFDHDLNFAGLIGSAEFLYADTLQEILYENVNLRPTGATAFDGRPTFTRVDAATGSIL